MAFGKPFMELRCIKTRDGVPKTNLSFTFLKRHSTYLRAWEGLKKCSVGIILPGTVISEELNKSSSQKSVLQINKAPVREYYALLSEF